MRTTPSTFASALPTRLTANLSITIPFFIAVLCCLAVVRKLRTDQRRESSEEQRTVLLLHNIAAPSQHGITRAVSVERQTSVALSTVGTSRQTSLLSSSPPPTTRTPLHRCQSHLQDTGSSRQASITITYLTAAFILCYGPYMVIWVHELLTRDLALFKPLEKRLKLTQHPSFLRHFSYVYLVSTNVLSTINSTAFPIIYFVRVKGQRIREFGMAARQRMGRWMFENLPSPLLPPTMDVKHLAQPF